MAGKTGTARRLESVSRQRSTTYGPIQAPQKLLIFRAVWHIVRPFLRKHELNEIDEFQKRGRIPGIAPIGARARLDRRNHDRCWFDDWLGYFYYLSQVRIAGRRAGLAVGGLGVSRHPYNHRSSDLRCVGGRDAP